MRFKSISLTVAMAFCLGGYAQNTASQDSTLVVADNQEAEVAFNAGNDFVAQKNYQEAVNSFTKALSFNPKFTKALVNRGFAKSELTDYSGAITDFTMAVELDGSPQTETQLVFADMPEKLPVKEWEWLFDTNQRYSEKNNTIFKVMAICF